jgi:hypothetical protein
MDFQQFLNNNCSRIFTLFSSTACLQTMISITSLIIMNSYDYDYNDGEPLSYMNK